MLTLNENGLYCPLGDFYIDPWRGVSRAIITHAHSDHARYGSAHYLATHACGPILKSRLGASISLHTLAYGESIRVRDVSVSLHPAGHILGSAQVRIEYNGRVACITGDYKREADPTCEAFEPQRCHLLVTESTFGLPIFRWPEFHTTIREIEQWWRANREAGKASVIYAYALGKSQRILSSIDSTIGPIYVHGALLRPTAIYREAGIALAPTQAVSEAEKTTDWTRALILAVPSAHGTPWLRRFGDISTAMASGWMAIRGNRRRRSMDRGFVISDHCDWSGLMQTVRESEAEEVWVTHGFSDIVARYLSEQGIQSAALSTQFEGEAQFESESEKAAESVIDQSNDAQVSTPASRETVLSNPADFWTGPDESC